MNWLKKLRLDAGMTQANLAKSAGVSEAEISRIECDHRNPNFNTLSKIARVFDSNAFALVKKIVDDADA